MYSFFLGSACFLFGFMLGAGIVAIGQQSKESLKKKTDIKNRLG